MKKFMNALTSIVLTSLAFVTLFVSCNNDDDDNSSNGGNAITLTADQIVGKWVVTDSNSPYASFEFTADSTYTVVENTADTSLQTHSGTYIIEGDTITLSDFGTMEITGFTEDEIHFSFMLNATGVTYNFVGKKVEAPTGMYTYYPDFLPFFTLSGDNIPEIFAVVYGDWFNFTQWGDADYMPDSENNLVLKITDPAGVVTTFAGDGTASYADGMGSAAKFNKPYGIIADASGNLYVTDTGNNRIRKITPAGVVSTFAGDGTADYANGTGTAAKFNYPHGITIDESGNLYVADSRNNRIRKITPAGVVSTFAGDGTAGNSDGKGSVPVQFNNPTGIYSNDGGKNFYVKDNNGTRVLVVPAP